MNNAKIQCYKVSEGEFLIAQMTRSEMKKHQFYDSPIDALNDDIEKQKYCLSNEEYAVKIRKEKIKKITQCLENYKSGVDDILLREPCVKIY